MSTKTIRMLIGGAGLLLLVGGVWLLALATGNLRGDTLIAAGVALSGAYALGVATLQVVPKRYNGMPAKTIQLRDAKGNVKPPPQRTAVQ